VMLNVGNALASAATAMNPESKPTWPAVEVNSSLRQGSANEDWVMVWFLDLNWNEMMSRGAAWIEGGLYERAPLSPTVTTWTTGSTLGVGAAEPGNEA